ncbi:hypothetical protein SAMN04488700_1647 [Carnobacterium iners]|uniref:Uncharacterized protein n=1 Tax=Carnobacterium iners TaxID=1073423 RepID=A0A1X7N9J9_9LACT|nr:hypothetical protein [Carnobacterium iners]SEK50028.1 hypothetical protein SAMN04488114_10510 [Carnobacterium iners]SMH34256.1 hypothetical protein SAMN04488700_1647 [Carnobacterium iners]
MLATVVYDFLLLAILLILLVSAYIIKVNSVKMLGKSNRLELDQIKSGVVIANTIFYTVLIVFLMMIASPFIIRLVAF